MTKPKPRTLVLHSSRYPIQVPAGVADSMTWEDALGGGDARFVEFDRFIAFPVSLAPGVTHWREAGWRLHAWQALAAAVRRGARALLFVPAGKGWMTDDPNCNVLTQTNGLLEAVCAAGPRPELHPLLRKPAGEVALVVAAGARRWREHLEAHRPDRELWGCDESDAARPVRPVAFLGNSRYRPSAAVVGVGQGLVVLLPLRVKPAPNIGKLIDLLGDEVRTIPHTEAPADAKTEGNGQPVRSRRTRPAGTRPVQYDGLQAGDLALVRERRRLWWQFVPSVEAGPRTARWYGDASCTGVLALLLVRSANGERLQEAELKDCFTNASGKRPSKGTFTAAKARLVRDLRRICADPVLDPVDALEAGTRVVWRASSAPMVRRVLLVEVEPGSDRGVVRHPQRAR